MRLSWNNTSVWAFKTYPLCNPGQLLLAFGMKLNAYLHSCLEYSQSPLTTSGIPASAPIKAKCLTARSNLVSNPSGMPLVQFGDGQSMPTTNRLEYAGKIYEVVKLEEHVGRSADKYMSSPYANLFHAYLRQFLYIKELFAAHPM